MRLSLKPFLSVFILLFTVSLEAAEYKSDWHNTHDRVWLGNALWANPIENWRLKEGRLECVRIRPKQNVQHMTHVLGEEKGHFETKVRTGIQWGERTKGWFGFMLGIKSELNDPRHSLIFGKASVTLGVSSNDKVFIKAGNKGQAVKLKRRSREYVLHCKVKPEGDLYTIQLIVHDAIKKEQLGQVELKGVTNGNIKGNFALTSDLQFTFMNWFADWHCHGSKLKEYRDRAFGPILWTQHSLSRGVMKMTVQMPPLAKEDEKTLSLHVRPEGQKNWSVIARSDVRDDAYTAHFKIEKWNDKVDTEYRVAYTSIDKSGHDETYYFNGTVRSDPKERDDLKLAGFTGNKDYIFPNNDLVKRVQAKNPDILFFSGDQLYENNGGFGIYRQPTELATLNYLGKWYLFGWSFRDLMRDRVSLILPDDHDVFQGNIWGEGGKGVAHIRDHNKGGYAMDPQWVNMVQRTQTWHHPDAYDPTPVEQGIGVYYGDMVYGRVSFAIIEDRKFKSGPNGKVNTWKGRPDHISDLNFDVMKLDKPGLKLLGDRQLTFLKNWSSDWKGSDMKAVLSATIFANLANYHGPRKQYLLADLDSNGWPQSGRNRALKEIRRGFGFMIAGDQHLASIVQHGIDEFDDAGFSFCVPSIAAGYPRSWLPKQAPVEKFEGMPKYTGKYFEGLKNRVSVWAVGNPENKIRKPLLQALHDRASGFGLVHFFKKERKIKMECFRLLNGENKRELQFPGWPKTIHMTDNYNREAKAWLPTIEWNGDDYPVLQVIEEASGEVVYTLRLYEKSFSPRVFAEGTYTIRLGEPGAADQKTFRGLKAVKEKDKTKISFSN